VIIIIKHIDIEGPETLGEYLKSKGYPLKIVDLHLGDKLPEDLSDVEAVVCLGGPMNVYEEDKYPFLKEENAFIKKIIKNEIPYLGICLGSQLLAKACGARVTKSPVKEVGWFNVDLTGEGKKDPLYQGMEKSIDVFQWHEDAFAIPKNGKWLACAEGCVHQSFRAGTCAYGIQFHIEITDKSIGDWSDAYFKNDAKALKTKKEAMLKTYAQKKKAFHSTAERVYSNFLKIVSTRNRQRSINGKKKIMETTVTLL